MSNSPNKINCPTCKKPFAFDTSLPTMPFCSERCQLLDLGKWMNEDIGLPHIDLDDEESDLVDSDTQAPEPIREWKFD